MTNLNLRGRVCLVTGANSGIGFAAAEALARRSATVVMLCRSQARGERARNEIRRRTRNDDVHLLLADLGIQADVRSAVREFRERFDELHVLVNNAGATFVERIMFEGIEGNLAVNVLGPFLLTSLLRGMLERSAPARIVNLVGISHKKATIDLDDLNWERRSYSYMVASRQAQLARAMFTFELARRLEGTGVVANAVHPGAVLTHLQRTLPWYVRLLIHTVMRPGFVSPKRGARPVVRVATDPSLEHVNGLFFDRMRVDPSTPTARDPHLGQRLWDLLSTKTDTHLQLLRTG